MIRTRLVVALALASLALPGVDAARQAKDTRAEVALQAAIKIETIDGDLKTAIEAYRKIVGTYRTADQAAAAKALLRMGECYETLGDAEARKAYEQLLREFADQKSAADQARVRLAALTGGAPSVGTLALRFTKVYSGRAYASAISPDGTRLAIIRSEMSSRDIWVRNVATGTENRLTNLVTANGDPVWSPDGQWIAFGDRVREIKSVPAAGGAVRTLFAIESGSPDLTGLGPTGWSSDSRKLVFRVPGKGLFSAPVAGGPAEPVCVFENPDDEKKREGLTLSPDGQWVAYSATENGNADIFVMRATGRSPVRVTTSPAIERKPRWSPDGHWIAFTSYGNENPQLWAVRVFPNGEPQGLPVHISRDANVLVGDWAGGGRVGFSAAFRTEHVYTANPDGSGEVQLTQFSAANKRPRWSPDGRWIAFRSDYRKSVNRSRLWVMPSAGGLARLISDLEVGSFVWSADGETLLLEVDGGLNRSLVMAAPAQGGPAREIMRIDGDIDGLSRSPDGRSLVFTFTIEAARWATTEEYLRDRTSGIGVVPTGGGASRILIPADKKGIWHSDCSLDPDGKRIAYIVFDHAQFKKEGMYSIWTVNLDGGSPRQITRGGEYGVAWSPDGKWILFEKRIEDMNFDLYKIPTDGGEPVAMNIRGQRPEFSPNGAKVVYSRTVDWGYEYWLAENVIPSGEGKVK